MKKAISVMLAVILLTNIFCIKINADTHTITFFKGATTLGGVGTGGTDSITVTVGQQLPASITPPVPPAGRVFVGYYHNPHYSNPPSPTMNSYVEGLIRGNGVRFYNAHGNRVFDEPWNGTTNITLFAVWADASSPIAHHENDTDDFERVIIERGNLLFPRPPAPPTPYHEFMGFFTERNGSGNRVANGEGLRLVTSLDSAHVYAHFMQLRFPLVFDKTGGEGGSDNMVLEFPNTNIPADRRTQLPATVAPPTRSGYSFAGYFFERDGTRFTAFNSNGSRAYTGWITSIEPFVVWALWRCDGCGEFENACICVEETTTEEFTTEPPTTTTTRTTTTRVTTERTTATSVTQDSLTSTDVSVTTTPLTTATAQTTTSRTTATTITSAETSVFVEDTTVFTQESTVTYDSVSTYESTVISAEITTAATQTATAETTTSTGLILCNDCETFPCSCPPPVIYQIVFDSNGGDPVESVNVGVTAGELPVPIRHGFEFVGWFMNPAAQPYEFTIHDALEILKQLAGISRLTQEQSQLYDFDGSGEITVQDALEVLKILAGMSEPPDFEDDDEAITAQTQITHDTTLIARWKVLPPDIPDKVAVSLSGNGAITLTWVSVEFADGYEIYRSSTRLGEYARIGTVSFGSVESYVDRGLNSGDRWFYTVRAFREVAGARLFGEYSVIVEGVAG
jgi:hypothetical protein